MVRLTCLSDFTNQRKWNTIFLAFIWICGLIFGAAVSGYAGVSFFSGMRGTGFGSVSIVGLLSVSLLPFLFSAFAVYIHSFSFLVMLCFIKGLLFSFVSIGILAAFESSGWLVRLLFMFSDLCCLVPLWWCWLSCVSGHWHQCMRSVAIATLIAAGIISFDYFFIVPFWAQLVEF